MSEKYKRRVEVETDEDSLLDNVLDIVVGGGALVLYLVACAYLNNKLSEMKR